MVSILVNSKYLFDYNSPLLLVEREDVMFKSLFRNCWEIIKEITGCFSYEYKIPYVTITGGHFPNNIGKKGIIIQSFDYYDKSEFERVPCSWIQIDGVLYRYFPNEFTKDA